MCAARRRARERYGGLDVLVNSAGIGIGASVEDAAGKHVDLQLGVNLRGLVLVTRAAIPLLESVPWPHRQPRVDRGHDGDARAARSTARSKAAVISFTRSLNEELDADGVRATALCPGFVDTDMAPGAESRATR